MNDLATLTTRESIEKLQSVLLTLPQLEVVTKHYLADGMYLRWLTLPKGAVFVGRVHRREHFFLCLQGTMQITNGDEPPFVMIGPCVIVSKPGTKRAGQVLDEVVCCTVHRTTETEVEEIEKDISEPAESSPYGPGNILKDPQLTLQRRPLLERT